MSDEKIIDIADLPETMKYSLPGLKGIHKTLAEVEKEHITNVLSYVNGNKTKAADILGIDRKTLREKLKR